MPSVSVIPATIARVGKTPRQTTLYAGSAACRVLEAARAAGRTLDIRVVGLASIAPDVTPDLACAAIASVSVLGALQASPAVKAALADRMR